MDFLVLGVVPKPHNVTSMRPGDVEDQFLEDQVEALGLRGGGEASKLDGDGGGKGGHTTS